MRNVFITLLFSILSHQLFAQGHVFQSGLDPSMAVTYPLGSKFKLTLRTGLNSTMFEQSSVVPSDWRYSHNRTDLQSFLSYSLDRFWKLSTGYQYRISESGRNSHRTIQQISFTRRGTGHRRGHRFRFAQTFICDASTQLHFHYRFSAEIPLSGLTLEPAEFYVLGQAEPVYTVKKGDDAMSVGAHISIGRYFNTYNKLELGPAYSIDRFLYGGHRQKLFVRLAYYLNIRR